MPNDKRRSPLLAFYAFYRHHLVLVGGCVLLSLVASGSMPLANHIIGLAVDAFLAGEAVRVDDAGRVETGGVWFWVLLLLGFTVVRGAVHYAAVIMSFVVGQRLLHDIRARVFDKVQTLDLGYHREHGAGELIARTTRDGDKIRDAVVIGSRMLLDMGAYLLGILVLLWWYHPSIGGIAAFALLLSCWRLWIDAGRLVRIERHAGDRYDELTQELTEGIHGVRVIKAFALQRERIRRFDARVERYADAHWLARRFAAWRLSLPQLGMGLAHSAVLVLGAWLAVVGTISIGAYLTASMLMISLVFRMQVVGRGAAMISEARAAAERLQELLAAEPAIVGGVAEVPDGPLGFALRGVVCRPGGRPVLERLDLRVAPGEVLAMVGPTGSGKSTFVHLLPRMLDPDAGAVSFFADGGDEVAAIDCDLASLRRRVQAVFQESFLFSDTVAGNLRLAAPEATDEQLWEALRIAAADDFVAAADGLATVVGERGMTLSGGQKQRLCLARALLAGPGLLVLDDATSALDASTEAEVHDRLRAATGGATVILIASRPSTVLLADRVVVLDEGRVVEEGAHEALLARSPRYRRLLGMDREDGDG